MDLTPASDGGIRGTAMVRATSIVTAVTCSGGPQLGTTETHGIAGAMVMGTTGSFGFDMSRSNTFPGDGTSPGGVTTQRWAFTGALNADVVMGTLTFTRTIVDNPASISTSLSITLR
jgi:hypothetical protein